MKKFRIGIDLGGTNIAAGITDENYNLIAKDSVKTRAPRPSEEICADMLSLCRALCVRAGLSFDDDIEGIGIASPGIILNGVVERASNLGFYGVPIAEIMKSLTGKQIVLRNDGNAAAYGEFIAGCGRGCVSLVAITLGTGVGGGIITNNKLLEGFNGAAAEIGHIVIHDGGRMCGCGKRGCLEAYCSATAIAAQTRAVMEKDPQSKLWEIAGTLENVDGKTAFDGMRAGDAAAREIVDGFIASLAVGVSNIINLLQPEIICIGGGLSREGEGLLAPVRALVVGQTYVNDEKMRTKIVTASLGNDAGIIGAAALEIH